MGDSNGVLSIPAPAPAPAAALVTPYIDPDRLKPPIPSSSISYSGVFASPPRTALACPCEVAAFGMFIAARAGASSS